MTIAIFEKSRNKLFHDSENVKTILIALILCLPVFYMYFFALNTVQDKITYILNDTLIITLMYFIAALSLDLEVGSLGLPNFGKVAFIAIGAYITTIIMNVGFFGNFFVDFLLGLVIALIISAFFGWLIAIPSVKLRADYFAIMTIAAGEIIRLILQYEKRYFWTLTDPARNIREPLMLNTFRQSISNTILFGFALSNTLAFNFGVYTFGWNNYILYTLDLNFGNIFYWQIFIFLFFLTIAFLCYALVEIIRRSPYGRTLRAIREDDITVTSVGKDVYSYRWQVTVIAAIICSISGSLFSIVNSSFEPIDFRPDTTFLLFVFIIIGGVGNSKGVAFGTLIIQMFSVAVTSDAVKNELNFTLSKSLPGIGPILQDFQLNFFISADYTRFILLGVILLLFLLYKPDGIIPEPKSNNETYLSLLTEDERKDSDLAVKSMQSLSEKERIQDEDTDFEV